MLHNTSIITYFQKNLQYAHIKQIISAVRYDMILIESIEKVWCEMREFVKSMECNQKLINQLGYSCRGRGSSLFDKWTSIRDYETAKKMLSETTIENIVDEIGLIGTAYFLTEQCKSVKYHSIAHELESILGDMFYCMGIRNRIQVSILDVKEKKLGYDRSKTVKVFRSDAPEVVLCYITAETTVCDVPKKQVNSTGKGLQITGITVSKPNTPLLSLFSGAGMDKAVIFDWVKRTRLTELRKCVDIAMNVLVDADDDSISESCRVAAEFSEKVQSLTNTYVKEIRKIQ